MTIVKFTASILVELLMILTVIAIARAMIMMLVPRPIRRMIVWIPKKTYQATTRAMPHVKQFYKTSKIKCSKIKTSYKEKHHKPSEFEIKYEAQEFKKEHPTIVKVEFPSKKVSKKLKA